MLAGGFVRENRGFDFAAWAHLMRADEASAAEDEDALGRRSGGSE